MTLKEIISKYNNFHIIEISKPNKYDRSTWTYRVTDPKSSMNGLSDVLYNGKYNFKITTFRIGDNFFTVYKILNGPENTYFVDLRKSSNRSSVDKYISNLINYSVLSNDISFVKNSSSFRVTRQEMYSNKINNFLDLCYYFNNYSSIGIGLTRNIRNLIVMDIDVDCTQPENEQELNDLLSMFGKKGMLPDFYIFNKLSKHVQLQWLVKDINYKSVRKNVVDSLRKELNADTTKYGEINYIKTDFLELTEEGEKYKRFTLGLCNIIEKNKFGDKNFTCWKAKNPIAALFGFQQLELRKPIYNNEKLEFMSHDEIYKILASKYNRNIYFQNAMTFEELYKKAESFIEPYMKEVGNDDIMNLRDDDFADFNNETKIYIDECSRHGFLLACSRQTTYETAKKHNFKNSKDIFNLAKKQFDSFMSEIKKIVRQKFREMDKKYKGVWPGTSNNEPFTRTEFDKTFVEGFKYGAKNFDTSIGELYSDEQRKHSMENRGLKKAINLYYVDRIRMQSNEKIRRDGLLKEVNKLLVQHKQKEISESTLKRCIAASKKLSEEDRKELYDKLSNEKNNREKKLKKAIESNQNKAYIKSLTDMYNSSLF